MKFLGVLMMTLALQAQLPFHSPLDSVNPDVWLSAEAGSSGDTVDSTLLSAALRGSGITLQGVHPSPLPNFKVASTNFTLPYLTFISSYIPDNGNRSYICDLSLLNYIEYNFDSSHNRVTAGCYFQTSDLGTYYNTVDWFVIHAPSEFASANLSPDPTNPKLWIHTQAGTGEGIVFQYNHRYWATMLYQRNGICKLRLYDAATHAQVNQTDTLPTALDEAATWFVFGAFDIHGGSPPGYVAYDNMMFDWTTAKWPLVPFSVPAEDTVNPTVNFITTSQTVTNTPFTVSGTVTDSGGSIWKTRYFMGNSWGNMDVHDATGTSSWSLEAVLLPGSNTNFVYAIDYAGNATTNSITLTYNPPAPVVHWQVPDSYTTYNGKYIATRYTVTNDNSVSSIHVNLLKYGTPTGNLTFALYSDSGTNTPGTIIGDWSNALDESTLTTSSALYYVTWAAPVAQTNGVVNWLVMFSDDYTQYVKYPKADIGLWTTPVGGRLSTSTDGINWTQVYSSYSHRFTLYSAP